MTKSGENSTIPRDHREARIRRIRVRSEDSAYVYSLFESYEGIASYSTLDHKPGDPHRDMELSIPLGYQKEVEALLKILGDMVYEIES